MNKIENLRKKYEILHTIDFTTPSETWYDNETMLKLLDVLNNHENTLFFTYDVEKNMYVICNIDRKTFESFMTLAWFYSRIPPSIYEIDSGKFVEKNITDALGNIFFVRDYITKWHGCDEAGQEQFDFRPYEIIHNTNRYFRENDKYIENEASKKFMQLMYAEEYYEGSILQKFNKKYDIYRSYDYNNGDYLVDGWLGNVMLSIRNTQENPDEDYIYYNSANSWRFDIEYYAEGIKQLMKLRDFLIEEENIY